MMPSFVAAEKLHSAIPAVVGLCLLGSILAQGCLLAAWLAWGDEPFGRRLIQHWCIAGVLCAVWLGGVFASVGQDDFTLVAFTIAMTVPLISVAAQLPLWLVRQSFGWRLVRASGDDDLQRDTHWSIRDLFLATLIVAVALGIARQSPAALQQKEFWYAWYIGGMIAAIVCASTVLPTAVFLLRLTRHGRGVAYAWSYAFGTVLSLWLVVGIIRWQGLTSLPPYFVFVGLSCLIISYASTVILAAKIARSLGYRLAMHSRQSHRNPRATSNMSRQFALLIRLSRSWRPRPRPCRRFLNFVERAHA
jgi:hypothetical protein